MPVLDKILDFIFPPFKDDERHPPCTNLYWTLPDNWLSRRGGRMKPVCHLGLNTKPTCGGFYVEEPTCGKYSSKKA